MCVFGLKKLVYVGILVVSLLFGFLNILGINYEEYFLNMIIDMV